MDEQPKKVPRKEIDQEKAKNVVSLFTERPKVLSPRKFIEANFHALNDGRKVADIHDFLVNNGIDVGSLGYFRKLWGEVKKQQKQNGSQPKNPSRSERTLPTTSSNLGSAAKLGNASSPALSENSKRGKTQDDTKQNALVPKIEPASKVTTVVKEAEVVEEEDKPKKRPLLYGEMPVIREDGLKLNFTPDGHVSFDF